MRLCAISVVAAVLTAMAQVTPARNSCLVVDPSSRVIAAADSLIICEKGGECLGSVVVPANGKIVLPLVGEIQVLGQTSDQLAQMIRERHAKYLRNPPVMRISVLDRRAYYVDGEVNQPGAYCLDAPTTVLEALDISGGFRKRANLSKIRILRGGQLFKFNYKGFYKGKHPEQNILIEAHDHIIVP